uniref:vitrin isoform X2 n=1 Tax=Myxine glutinosa TaxID=7769 RepID=UPI00358E9B59
MKLSILFILILLIVDVMCRKRGKRRRKKIITIIDCDLRAGSVVNHEFVVRCPPGCREKRVPVWGTGHYASISSICGAAIHSGMIRSSGGPVRVKKSSGRSDYLSSVLHNIRSLPLPKWSGSFQLSAKDARLKKGERARIKYVRPVSSSVSLRRKFRKKSTNSPTTRMATTIAATSVTPIAITNLTTISNPTTTTLHMVTQPQPPSSAVTTVVNSRRIEAKWPVKHNYSYGVSSQHSWPWNLLREADAKIRAMKPKLSPSLEHPRKPKIKINSSSFNRSSSSSSSSSSSRTRNTTPKPTTLPPPKLDCKVDVAFLMEGSWSIGKRRFAIQKSFLGNVVKAMGVGPQGAAVGLVQFGNEPTTEFNLKSQWTSKEAIAAIQEIKQQGGYSNVGKGLQHVYKTFFLAKSGNRGRAPNVAVVLLDGWPSDAVKEPARLAREAGINIFMVTVEEADQEEKKLVSEADFVNQAVCRTSGYFSLSVPSWNEVHKFVRPLVERVCTAEKLLCSKTCLNSADISFVVDGSSSVGSNNFRTVLQFVANVSRSFDISDTATRISMVQYTYEQRVEFPFNKSNNKEDVLNAIQHVNYWNGGTATGAAINYAVRNLFSTTKPNKRKILIVITDGRSYDDVRGPSADAHKKGTAKTAEPIATKFWVSLVTLSGLLGRLMKNSWPSPPSQKRSMCSLPMNLVP